MNHFEMGSMLTADSTLKTVLETAANVASSKATVLISGESGTGKELLARFIHERSPRASRPLVAINCAALPEGLLESELFGFERGAFTGAISQKIGKFELAHNSTILLDEVSELPLTLQAKLLRVLQEEEVDRLGGKAPVKVSIRVVATTNRDLREMVRAGLFREDLFYRLNVIPLNIPSLRERPQDIGLLAEHFVKVSAILNQRTVAGIETAGLEKLRSWNWPGNVRELENVIERAVLMSKTGVVKAEDIWLETSSQLAPVAKPVVNTNIVTIAEMERALIFKALEHTRQNRTQAAKILGISIRTLRNKLNEYRLEVSGG